MCNDLSVVFFIIIKNTPIHLKKADLKVYIWIRCFQIFTSESDRSCLKNESRGKQYSIDTGLFKGLPHVIGSQIFITLWYFIMYRMSRALFICIVELTLHNLISLLILIIYMGILVSKRILFIEISWTY